MTVYSFSELFSHITKGNCFTQTPRKAYEKENSPFVFQEKKSQLKTKVCCCVQLSTGKWQRAEFMPQKITVFICKPINFQNLKFRPYRLFPNKFIPWNS